MSRSPSRAKRPLPVRFRDFIGLAALLLAVPGGKAAGAQTPAGDEIPRTSEGRPDFHGIWSSRWLTPVERPAGVESLILSEEEAAELEKAIRIRADQNNLLDPELSDPDAESLAIVRGEYRSSLVIDPPNGRMPFTDEGRSAIRRYIGGLDGPEQRMTTERCIGGVGWAPLQIRSANMLHRFVQTEDHVVLHTEAYDDLRIFPIDGEHLDNAVTSPTGDSVARWDGDRLVVATTNFDPDFSTRGIVTVMSPNAQIEETFEFAGPNEIVYRYTIDDPAYYSAPWTVEYSLERTPQDMYEFACHESNYSLTGMLFGARLAERTAQEE